MGVLSILAAGSPMIVFDRDVNRDRLGGIVREMRRTHGGPVCQNRRHAPKTPLARALFPIQIIEQMPIDGAHVWDRHTMVTAEEIREAMPLIGNCGKAAKPWRQVKPAIVTYSNSRRWGISVSRWKGAFSSPTWNLRRCWGAHARTRPLSLSPT